MIAELLRQAVARGMKVLFVSQMHQAVDNALAAVMEDPTVPVLRLGNDPSSFRYGTEKVWPTAVSPDGRKSVNEGVIREFERRLSVAGRGFALASTNSGIGTDWFFARHLERSPRLRDGFDLVIMDESSRETLAGALVPLSYLKTGGKAIFVGDAKQLPPFGLSDEEIRQIRLAAVPQEAIAAYQRSVFEWLLENGQGDRVMLSTNYRSHPLIAGLVSALFYDGDLHRRGWEDFDSETLSLRVVDLAEEPDVYYDRPGPNGSYVNGPSASRTVELARVFQARGVPLQEITVITPYAAQVELIRRLNVALSRARETLAIIWDSRTFAGEVSGQDTKEDRQARALFQRLLDYYESEVSVFFSDPEVVNGNGGAAESAGMEEAAPQVSLWDTRSVVFAGAGPEADRFVPVARAAGISTRPGSPRGKKIFLSFLLAVLSEASGLSESAIAARDGFERFAVGVSGLGRQA